VIPLPAVIPIEKIYLKITGLDPTAQNAFVNLSTKNDGYVE
tara:strand:- start:44 stop:166 length:123 start_codon:yes stop_codon:yes gene_type:complete